MTAARFSVVIPVLDEAATIDAALHALAPLRAQGAEVVVVDGQSRDDSAARAARGADRVLVAARGRARQMNAGAAQARGDVLLFLHADTQLPARALEAIDAALAPSPAFAAGSEATSRAVGEAGAVPVWGRFDVSISGRSPMLGVIAALMNLRSRGTGVATGDQAIFVTRAAFEQVGGFPDQPLMEDIELSKRLGRLGAPACLRERVVTSGRRWETRGVWRTIALMWRLRLLYRLGVAPDRLARGYR